MSDFQEAWPFCLLILMYLSVGGFHEIPNFFLSASEGDEINQTRGRVFHQDINFGTPTSGFNKRSAAEGLFSTTSVCVHI